MPRPTGCSTGAQTEQLQHGGDHDRRAGGASEAVDEAAVPPAANAPPIPTAANGATMAGSERTVEASSTTTPSEDKSR